jgi:stage V sporulation protein AE
MEMAKPSAGKRRIIFVTDGDDIARKAVEKAVSNIGGRCISASAGNPTPISGQQLIDLVKKANHDPVVVMVDDRGSCRKGKGEEVLEYVAQHPDIEVIGVLAVASNTESIEGIHVDYAVTKNKEVVDVPVDKCGNPAYNSDALMGDTVDVLNELEDVIPVVVGIGDIGKMEGKDSAYKGAEITTKALELVIKNWEARQCDHNNTTV